MTLDQIQMWTDINISNLKTKYNLNNFVETGVYLGASVQIAYDSSFTSVYSCDIDNNHVSNARNRFPHANIFSGDSITFLKDVLPKLTGKTLFWLDAHFPEFYNFAYDDPTWKMPLFTELELIKEHKADYAYDVIMCDDMRVMRNEKNPKYVPGELEEYLYIDMDWDAFVNQFSDTHDYQLLMPDSGAIIWTPKA